MLHKLVTISEKKFSMKTELKYLETGKGIELGLSEKNDIEWKLPKIS